MNQYRNHRNVALQRGFGFQVNEVIRIVQPAPVFGIGGGQPVLANDREKHAARRHLLCDDAPKIASRLDAGLIHEDRGLAEVPREIL